MKPWQRLATGGAGAAALALSMVGYFEGERLIAYRDVGGVETICDGETHGVYAGMTATHAQCVAWATQEIQGRLATVDRLTVKRQPDTRRAALADFAYNEGDGALAKSLALRLINRGQITAGCNALMNWTSGGGKTLPWLIQRRQAERELCLENNP